MNPPMDLAERERHLTETLERLGVVVRREVLPGASAGGLCTIRGARTLFVSPSAPRADRVAILISALRALDHEDLYLPPAIRALL